MRDSLQQQSLRIQETNALVVSVCMLYAHTQAVRQSAIYGNTNFAYATPSTLLLEPADGESIQSTNGVRQDDPFSTLLFCHHMRDVYASDFLPSEYVSVGMGGEGGKWASDTHAIWSVDQQRCTTPCYTLRTAYGSRSSTCSLGAIPGCGSS